MKKILIFFLIICHISFAEQKITNVASVNNFLITNIDIQNETIIMSLLNKQINSNSKNIKQHALNNLTIFYIKKDEINKNNIIIDTKILNSNFYNFLNKYNINIEKLPENLSNIIYEKIKQDAEWNYLISQQYSWKININMQEVDEKVKSYFKEKIDASEKQIISLKEKIIQDEKNKKLEIYSAYHLNLIKKNSLVKYFQ